MSEGKSLVNATDLSGIGTAARAVCKAVGDAIGTLYEPVRIRRAGRAQADVEAYAIKTRAEAESVATLTRDGTEADLLERASARLRASEIRRQRNIESVVDHSLLTIEASAIEAEHTREITPDWMEAFIRHVQDCSDETIQALWSRILAGEADSRSHHVSKATLDAMRLLEAPMAAEFKRLIQLYAATGQIMDIDDHIIDGGAANIHFELVMALEEIGFLRRETRKEPHLEFKGYILEFDEPILDRESRPLQYFERTEIRIDRMIPTWRGQELAEICLPGYFDYAAKGGESDKIDLGPYQSETALMDLLTFWASEFTRRGIAVFLRPVSFIARTAADGAERHELGGNRQYIYHPKEGWLGLGHGGEEVKVFNYLMFPHTK